MIRELGAGDETALTRDEYHRLRDVYQDPPTSQPLLRAVADEPSRKWMSRAACRGAPLEIFYQEGAGLNYVEARQICGTCPVVPECRDAGIREVYGVWGGMSPDDRRTYQWPPMARHGHSGGRLAHQRRGEKPCDECAEAWRRYAAGRREAAR